MPTLLDIVFAVFFAIVVAGFEAAHFDRRFKRQVAAGVPDARRHAYRRGVLGQWVLGAAAIVVWSHERRPWRALGLLPPTDWRLIAGFALAVVIGILVVRQNLSVRRLPPERAEKLRPKLAGLEFMLPHTAAEYRWFLALSWTAGVCEELLYRGFLTWLVASYVGLVLAIAIVSAVFGLAHAYQGRRGIVKTGTAALLMSGVVLLSGWLIPAMIIHGLTNVAAAVVGHTVLSREPVTPG